MTPSTKTPSLPLRLRTPDSWAVLPLSHLPALLSDHAYLERKAASNALELLNRWPSPFQPDNWTLAMAGVARDEALHLRQVIRLIRKRGWKLERLHRSLYAGGLRELVRMGKGIHEILDRLLVSAIIEVRSCERFGILGRMCPDQELRDFYRGLHVAEMGHYRVFTQMAEEILPCDQVAERWNWILDAEARVMAKQAVGVGLHSWISE
ncbi:MAG: hypothetical protein KCHDKBKB_02309 [Elusimicrobia bacterium]|nr:hypothetical protein [Elusimicrobiota bacterium]